MFTAYVEAAMQQAQIRRLNDDDMYFGSIPALDGVWATGDSPDTCRVMLREVLEEWLMVGLAHHQPIPPVDGIELAVREVA